jgi:hypothetical protein
VQSLLLQLAIALVGFLAASAALGAPEAVRLPVDLVACLCGPGVLFFRSFPALADPAVRAGASLIAVLASWTGWSTLVLSLGLGMSDRTVDATLALVYMSGIVTFLALRAAARASGRRR